MQAKLIGIQCYTAYLLWLTNKKKDQLSSADSSFNLAVIAGHSTCVYCLPFCAFLQASLLFLHTIPNSNSTKNCLCTSTDLYVRKLSDFDNFKFQWELRHTILIFLFIRCGRLSWLPVSFLLDIKYTLSYRIITVIFPSNQI